MLHDLVAYCTTAVAEYIGVYCVIIEYIRHRIRGTTVLRAK